MKLIQRFRKVRVPAQNIPTAFAPGKKLHVEGNGVL